MKLLSTKKQIGQLVQNMGVDIIAYRHLFPQWFEDAISIMGIPDYYVIRREEIEVVDNKALLPCDIENLHSLWITTGLTTLPNTCNGLVPLVLRDNPLIGSELVDYGNVVQYGNINGNYLYTTFKTGKVLVIFKGMPLDEEGYPQVPDNANFRMALEYYLVYRLIILGYSHPAFTFQTARQLWELHYPRAANDINWMDLQAHQDFEDMWTNPLLGDIRLNAYNN